MLKAVLLDFARAVARRPGHATSSASSVSAGGRSPGRALTKLHYSRSVPALMQMPITMETGADVMNICRAIELENRYIPSGFKWAVEHARFKVHTLMDDRAAALRSIRMAIGQAPYRTDLIDEYRRMVSRPDVAGDLALVVSCKKYELKALRLAKQLETAQIDFRIVTGNDTRPIAHERAMQVDASDTYEALPRKTIAALTWVYEEVGSNIGVIKLDDDQTLVDPQRLKRKLDVLHQQNAYAGVPVSGETHDRNWHWNKCQDPALNRTSYGRPYFRPWGKGGAYYVGPGPLEKLVTALIRYPGLFEGEYYEDKLVGDVLMLERVELTEVKGYEEFGVALTEEHRFIGG